MVRDSKGWWIDRRRSVTRYSCQQAAGIASPFPTFRFLYYYPIPVRATLAGPSTLSLVRYGCRVTQEYSPRKCSIDVFSATRPLDGILRARFPPLASISRVPFPAYRASPFTPLQHFIPRSWNTAAVTLSLALIGANCSIFLERRCIDLELRTRRHRRSADSRPMSAEN